MKRADDAQVSEPARASAGQGEGDRVAREKAGNARHVHLVAAADMVMPIRLADGEPVAGLMGNGIAGMGEHQLDVGMMASGRCLGEQPFFQFRRRRWRRGVGQQHDLVGIALADAVPGAWFGVGGEQQIVVVMLGDIEGTPVVVVVRGAETSFGCA